MDKVTRGEKRIELGVDERESGAGAMARNHVVLNASMSVLG